MKIFPLLFLGMGAMHLYAAEPSAFGAGNLDSEKPYGLTESEKHIYKNRSTLKKIENITQEQQSEVQMLAERVDGLQTIVEGLNDKTQSNKLLLKSFQNAYRLDQANLQKRDHAFEEQAKEVVAAIQINEQNIAQLKVVMEELAKMIDVINAQYVSKEEHNALVKDFNEFKVLVADTLKKHVVTSNPFEGKSNAQIAKEAKKLYDKKHYTKAIEYYNYLIKKGYKPARGSYMAGESYYYKKNYKNAIAYYKKSASLYDKASYMPTLMFHSAVALEKTGQKSQAKVFYNALISKYPESSVVKQAKKRLAKLK